MGRMRIVLITALALAALAPIFADEGLPLVVAGSPLDQAGCAAFTGGETYIDVDISDRRATVTSIPRDRYGIDYSRASSFTVEAKNQLAIPLQAGKGDFYQASPFPRGETTMSVVPIIGDYKRGRYGSSSGEWIYTPATRRVLAYDTGSNGLVDRNKPYYRSDNGYFIHTNTGMQFSEAYSAGCILVRKESLDRMVSAIKADKGPKRLSVGD